MVNIDRCNPHKQKCCGGVSQVLSVKSPEIKEFEKHCPNHVSSGLIMEIKLHSRVFL